MATRSTFMAHLSKRLSCCCDTGAQPSYEAGAEKVTAGAGTAGRATPLPYPTVPAMPGFDTSQALDPVIRRAMVFVAAVFFVKASLLGLFVTPLWDVPDETGHYALIGDIVSGRGLPLMGRSVIPDAIYEDWMRRPAQS